MKTMATSRVRGFEMLREHLEAGAPTLTISQTAHGFAVGDWIARAPSRVKNADAASGNITEGNWALASITPDPSDLAGIATDNVTPLSLVTRVVDANTVEVVQQGYFRYESSTYADFTTYHLGTGGALIAEAARRPGATEKRPRVVLYSMLDGWVYIVGPYTGDNAHSHSIANLADVDLAEGPGLTDVDGPDAGVPIAWDLAGEVKSPARRWRQFRIDGRGMAQAAALSVWGNATSSTANMAAIVGTTVGHVLQIDNSGGPTILKWGTLATASLADKSVTMAKLADLAGLSVIGRSANSTGVPAAITAVTDGHVLRLSGTTLGFGTVVAAGLATDSVTTIKIVDANVTMAKLADLAGFSIIGRASSSTGVPSAITAASDDLVLRRTAGSVGFGTVDTGGITNLAITTGKIAANAVTTAKMDALITGGGPTGGAITVPVITWDASGRLTAVTTATVTLAALGAGTMATINSPVPVANGGLAKTSVAADKMLYASAANVYAELSTTSFGRSVLNAADAAALRVLAAENFSAADKIWYSTGANTQSETGLSSFMRTLLDDPDQATAQATLGVTASVFTGFNAYHSSFQTITTGSYTTVVFDSANLNIGTCYGTGTGIFTCVTAGKYLFTFCATVAAVSTTTVNHMTAFFRTQGTAGHAALGYGPYGSGYKDATMTQVNETLTWTWVETVAVGETVYIQGAVSVATGTGQSMSIVGNFSATYVGS